MASSSTKRMITKAMLKGVDGAGPGLRWFVCGRIDVNKEGSKLESKFPAFADAGISRRILRAKREDMR